MRVIIKGVTPMAGVNHLACGGRFFPTGGDGKSIEVLGTDEDPPEITILVENSTTKEMVPTKRPDPDRMGKKSLEEIRKDGRFQIIQLDMVSSSQADAAVGAMRQRVQELTSKNDDLEIACAQLEALRTETADKLAALQVEHDALAKHAAELEEMIGGAPAKDKSTAPAASAATPPVASTGGAPAPTT